MRTQILRIRLAETSRTVDFRPGLNIIHGPISTGKTSLLRLCRAVFGASLKNLPEEVRLVPGISSEILIGDRRVQIYRPLTSTPTARVEIAGDELVLRLPALAPDKESRETYGQFLLGMLGLPRLEVPSAPTLSDSDPTPVSINDYFQYCDLPKEEIRSEVFGHRHPFKDIKRRYVFQVLYGQYDVQTAKIHEDLRELRARLRPLRMDSRAFDRLFSNTRFGNRADVEKSLRETEKNLATLRRRSRAATRRSREDKMVLTLQNKIRGIEGRLRRTAGELEHEKADLERFKALTTQLENQINRLTRAIVAGDALLDIDFVVCPRCGSSIDREARCDSSTCYLCLQTPKAHLTRRDLIQEQARLVDQLGETKSLSESRQTRVDQLDKTIETLRTERSRVGNQLDDAASSFVSDAADELQSIARERGEANERIKRLRDDLRLVTRRDKMLAEADDLERKEAVLMAQLEDAKAQRNDVEERIKHLEEVFTRYLRELKLPDFLDDPVGKINRITFMPTVNGRSFDDLQSEGLSIEVNLAHALAHQTTAIDLGLPLPHLLLIDGLSGAFGDEGFDPARVDALYGLLARACEAASGTLQVIAVDTRVSQSTREFVALELTENDRLIPLEDLARLREQD